MPELPNMCQVFEGSVVMLWQLALAWVKINKLASLRAMQVQNSAHQLGDQELPSIASIATCCIWPPSPPYWEELLSELKIWIGLRMQVFYHLLPLLLPYAWRNRVLTWSGEFNLIKHAFLIKTLGLERQTHAVFGTMLAIWSRYELLRNQCIFISTTPIDSTIIYL